MNLWIQHVKEVAAKEGIPYVQALKIAAQSYKGRATKEAPSKTNVGEEDYTTKKTDEVFHEKGKDVKKARRPYQSKRRIDFSKMNWGAFTKDWKEFGSEHPTLKEFATIVVAEPKAYPGIIRKRARFYLNVLTKGKGLDMCS